MSILTQASHEWMKRPNDQRYLNLPDMKAHFDLERKYSAEKVVPTSKVTILPVKGDNTGLVVQGPKGFDFAPTHWSFGQLATLGKAPAGYLRTLPSPMAADCLNFGLKIARDIEDVGLLLHKNGGTPTLRAATGPKYGRIWNNDLLDEVIKRFGDGVTGAWKIPGEFGKKVAITKANTTLYASDRDFFIFLADEENRIILPNRRDGKSGSLARGWFMWNSEVGSTTFGISMFLFDYACKNRIVWGVTEKVDFRLRHTVSAPDKWLAEIQPALIAYQNSSGKGVLQAIEDARKDRLEDRLQKFLADRFSKELVKSMTDVHMIEEGRPIETRWDAVVAATAVARSIEHQDVRVKLEREAGSLLKAS